MPVNRFRDETTESMTNRIVTEIAEETGRDPFSLPPLYTTIDPDKLTTLIETAPEGDEHGAVTVTFEHAGCTVTVSSTDGVDVTVTSA